jgi:hypothetical protein
MLTSCTCGGRFERVFAGPLLVRGRVKVKNLDPTVLYWTCTKCRNTRTQRKRPVMIKAKLSFTRMELETMVMMLNFGMENVRQEDTNEEEFLTADSLRKRFVEAIKAD